MAINRHLLHVKSNQTVTTTVDNESVTRAKLPSPTNIEHGEIAINYHDGYETISIKNDNDEIVEFPNLNAVNTLINDGDKIKSLTTYETSTPLAVGDTHDQALSKLSKIIKDDEEITARALTDLNETKQDEITDLDTIRSGAALGATALQSETKLSKGTATGDGNVVTDIAVNNHQITLTMGLTALTENALKTVNSLSLIGDGNIDAEDVIFGKLVEGSGMLVAKNFYRFNGTYSQKPTDMIPSPDFSDTAETPNDKKIYVDILTQKIYWYTSNSGILAGQGFKELCEVDLSSYADGVEYDSTEKKIYLKHGATRLSNPIDATDFIKDGMVNSVRIDTLDDGSSDDGSDGYEEKYLIITFNTDAGMEDIEIPLSDIFDHSLYYTKEEIDEHELVTAAALTELHNTKQDLLTFDSTPTANSTNPVTSGGIKTSLDSKQDALTFDSTPTANSTNPVTSGGVYAALSNVNTDHLTEITYSELKTLRDNDELVPGMFYRITDYQCTTTQENTQSAGHQFDIILLALSENKLAEEGWAMHHANDTYFANSNLSAWKVWYCLDNDKSRFAWADDSVDESTPANITRGNVVYVRNATGDDKTKEYPYGWISESFSWRYTQSATPNVGDAISPSHDDPGRNPSRVQSYTPAHEGTGLPNGRGVIYRLIDEFNNDIKYDFKNIQFKRKITNGQYDENGTETWCYTLNVWYKDMCQDASIVGNTLPNDEGFVSGVYDNNFGYATAYDFYIEGVNTFAFALGDNVVLSIDEGGEYYGIYSNTIGNYFGYNTIGNYFNNNTIGNNFNTNTIGNDFVNNTIGNYFVNNTIGNDFVNNTIGNYFGYNTIGNYFNNNTIGNDSYSNTIGTGTGSTATTIGYVRYIRVEDGVQFVNITTTATTSSSAYLQNITISQGIAGTPSSRKTISHPTVGDTFKTTYQSANSQVVSV